MDPNKKKLLDDTYEQLMLISTNQAPLEGLDKVVDGNVMGWGTTIDEVIYNLPEYQKMVQRQEDQAKTHGLEFTFERKEIFKTFSKDGNTAIIAEDITLTTEMDGSINRIPVRYSAILEYKDSSWKLIHWHGSVPSDTEDDTWHVEEWKAEKQKLEELVAEKTADLEEKNRELTIEAILDRVRGRSMGMQKSEELIEVVREIGKGILELGIQTDYTQIYTDYTHDPHDGANIWVNVEGQDYLEKFFIPYLDHPIYLTFYEKMEEGVESFSDTFSKSEKDSFFNALFQTPDLKRIPDARKDKVLSAPGWVRFTILLKNSSLHFGRYSNEEFTSSETEIFERFGTVFEQAYTRFLDLKKAESQAKEAQIEMALEKVRSRSLSMNQTSELTDVIKTVNEQFKELGVDISGGAFIVVNESLKDGFYCWGAGGAGDYIQEVHIPFLDRPIFTELAEGIKKGPGFITEYYSNEEKREFLQHLFKHPPFQHTPPDRQKEILAREGGYVRNCIISEHTSIFIINHHGRRFSKEDQDILKRMGKVFEQAYTRFLDLQRAEAQARESRIELSLERIRAQVSAMHESSELLDIVVTMRTEFVSLGYDAHYFWYMRWFPEEYEKAMTSGDGSKIGMVMTLPRSIHSDIASVAEWEEGEEETFVLAMEPEMAVDYVNKMITLGDFERVDPNAPSLDDIREIGGLTFIMARTSLGEIGYSLPGVVPEPPKEAMSTLVRFAGVFDLAYKRFEDLKKAERQAYESKVEASLERVRGMAAAMNHSDDLMQIAEAMFKEMEILKINPLRYGLGMINGETKEAELWASTVDDGHYLDMLGTLSLTWHPMLQQAFDAWDAQHEEVVYKLEGKELSDYYLKIGQVNPDIPDLKQLQDPETDIVQFASFFPFKTGALYAFTKGEPDEQGRSILKRFANVFEQAHIRYEDLQVTERQARLIEEERDRLEITLKELQATQDQLIQQEKLASLGQLTAGIAHEIKNPLNFVNNFSDLSAELIEEAKEELSLINGQFTDENKQRVEEALEILNDIEMNLRKIHEHGSRADSIVKSMLEHSRGGTGKKEPTDLNALLKEFVNLSFHGMRASKEPINVDIRFELSDSMDKIPLIAEDFSRVILNLCNNAFDAMKAKVQASDHPDENSYRPALSVQTGSENDYAILEIKDNGTGFPEEIKGKILQPFFTTKKGTEGTGLGLSITNDIIKAHGGELHIHSENGKGATFKILLKKEQH